MKFSLKSLLLTGAMLGLSMGGIAHADAITFFGSPTTILQGTTPVAAIAGTTGDVTVQTNTPGAIVTGSATNLYAAPITADGTAYTGAYFSTGLTTPSIANGSPSVTPTSNGVIDFSFSQQQRYFGLLWGSVDGQTGYENVLSFYNSSGLIGSVTGAEIAAAANVPATGVRTQGGSAYININVAGGYNEVVAGSQKVSFEFAAVTASTQTVPEPDSLLLLGTGLLGLAMLLRRRQRG